MKHARLVANPVGAAHARNLTRFLGTAIYRLDVRGSHHVPTSGPVILAANHCGLLDGPVLVATSPRPVHTLSKSELFSTDLLAALMHWGGQISVEYRQPDRGALARAVATLEAGAVLGIFPEGHRSRGDVAQARNGIGYLLRAIPAPVVPVAILGTRKTGKSPGWMPGPGQRISVTFGEPVECGNVARTLRGVSYATEQIRQVLAAHVEVSQQRVGIRLPDDVIEHSYDAI